MWNNTDIKNVARNAYFFLASPQTSFGVIMCDKWTPKDVCGAGYSSSGQRVFQ